MSGNFKIRYTLPLSSGAAIANKLESYLNSAVTNDISSSTALPNLVFQRALHKQGVFAFQGPNTPTDLSTSTACVLDLSGGFLRVRAVNSTGVFSTERYIDCSTNPAGVFRVY